MLKRWRLVLWLFALGPILMAAGFGYYVAVNGFPVPVVDASHVTDADMARINGPDPLLAAVMWNAGVVALGLATALSLFKLVSAFVGRRRSSGRA